MEVVVCVIVTLRVNVICSVNVVTWSMRGSRDPLRGTGQREYVVFTNWGVNRVHLAGTECHGVIAKTGNYKVVDKLQRKFLR